MSETATEQPPLDMPELEPVEGPNGTPDADPDDPGRAVNPDTGQPYTDAELEATSAGGLQLPGAVADPGRGAAAGGPAMGGGSSGPRVVNNFNLNVLTGWFKGWFSGNHIASPKITTPIVRPKAIGSKVARRTAPSRPRPVPTQRRRSR